MERTDIELIKRYKNSDLRLAHVWNEHQRLEKEILEKEHATLAAHEHSKISELKKEKLKWRDELEKVLANYRNN